MLMKKGKFFDRKKKPFDQKKGPFDQKKRPKMTKTCHFLVPLFIERPHFDQKCRFGVLIEKRGEMMEKREKRKKRDSSFFDSRFSQGLNSGREEPGRNKTSTPLSSRTHFHLFGSAPLFPRGVFSRSKKSMSLPLASDQRQALMRSISSKMTSQTSQ